MLGIRGQKTISALKGVLLFGGQNIFLVKIILNTKKKHIGEYARDVLGFLSPTTKRVPTVRINVRGKQSETITTGDTKPVAIAINTSIGGLELLMDMLQAVKIIIVRTKALILNGLS